MKEIYKCFIRTLSPIHIGCDEVYEPMGFVVDEGNNELIVFNPISFIAQMNENDKNRFSAICSSGTIESILQIYKFLKNKRASGKSVQLCAGFVDHYNKTLSIPLNNRNKIKQELNSFSISRTSFLAGDDRPYIPGSSIKGSLRTAYLNYRQDKQSVRLQNKRDKDASKDLEAKLLDYEKYKIETDPFRLVKTSDFMPVGNIRTRVMYATNIKKASGGEARGPFQIIEAIEPGSRFSGVITVEKPLDEKTIKNPIGLEPLLQSSKTFYSKEYKREKDELRIAGINLSGSTFSADTIPIRLGRHSGAESVTIEGHRNIKIMGRKGEITWDDHATTLWLASERSKAKSFAHCKPFGWAEFCELNSVTEQEFEQVEKNWIEVENSQAKGLEGIGSNKEPEQKTENIEAYRKKEKEAPEFIIWENVHLSWSPGNNIITASFEGKRATVKGKECVPEYLKNKFFGKKKNAIAEKVKVEPIGNSYRIVEIL